MTPPTREYRDRGRHRLPPRTPRAHPRSRHRARAGCRRDRQPGPLWLTSAFPSCASWMPAVRGVDPRAAARGDPARFRARSIPPSDGHHHPLGHAHCLAAWSTVRVHAGRHCSRPARHALGPPTLFRAAKPPLTISSGYLTEATVASCPAGSSGEWSASCRVNLLPSKQDVRRFRDRREAGVALADRLEGLRHENPVVLALPRGGVPVAFEVARALHAPLDVMVVRKLGVPFQPELGMGAIGEGDARVLDPGDRSHRGRSLRTRSPQSKPVNAPSSTGRVRLYRRGRPMASVQGRTVIVVDDGIATGGTARAAVQIARSHGARRVVLARAGCRARIGARARRRRGCGGRSGARRARSTRSARGTSISPRPPTTKYARCSTRRRPQVPGDDDPVDDDPADDRSRSTMLDASTTRWSCASEWTWRSPVTSRFHVARMAWCCSRTGAGAADTAPATSSWPLACMKRGLATLPFDLLSPDEALERANVFDVELLAVRLLAATLSGSEATLVRGVSPSATSAPVPARAQHCGQRARTPRSPQSCLGAAVPTLPRGVSRRSKRRRC